MLMRNPEYTHGTQSMPDDQAHSPRELLLGQVLVILLFVIAILMRLAS